jgi:membrane associated rhomboid family serine protease/tetratricopeptide (TPR) repeat protein
MTNEPPRPEDPDARAVPPVSGPEATTVPAATESAPEPPSEPSPQSAPLSPAPALWVTPTIVAANILVFVAMIATGVSPFSPSPGDLFKWGANFGPATLLGHEYWRLLTCAFVHVGLLHLAFNMYAFLGAGQWMERVYGSRLYLALYLVAALGGSVVSTLWAPEVVSAGASGAIFGVYGGLLAFTQVARVHLADGAVDGLQRSALGFVGYNLFYGLVQPNISNSAHLGGLAAGFAAGWLLAPDFRLPAEERPSRAWRLAAIVPVVLALAYAGQYRIARLPSVRSRALTDEAQTALRASDWGLARRRLDEAIAADPQNAWAYFARAYARSMSKDTEGALADSSEAIARNPKLPEPFALRCGLLFQKQDLARAAQECDAAIALDPANAPSWHVRVEILRSQGKKAQALEAATRLAQLSPQSAHPHVVIAGLLIDKGDLDAADAEVHEAARLEPDGRGVDYVRRHLLLRRGDFAAAEKSADRAVALAPTDPTAYSQRAQVYRAEGDLRRALADETRAVELDPNNGSWHNGRAWALLQAGRLQDALAAANRSLALEPDSPYGLGTRCWIRVSLGDRGGEADCRRSVALRPEGEVDQGMLDYLGGRYHQAASRWHRGSSEDPADAAYLATWIAKAEAGARMDSKHP